MKDEHLKDDRNIKQSSWHLEDVTTAIQAEVEAGELDIHDGRAEDVVVNEALADEDDREAAARAEAADARVEVGKSYD
ncbi:hypothetical protein [Gorillibacterium sp. CAU 1737]|uniref:hypothetical protein n=1 Tax=Gorillibacterium sp. CAU 1737 TaxID=3140362 RepID=UPI00325FE5E4